MTTPTIPAKPSQNRQRTGSRISQFAKKADCTSPYKGNTGNAPSREQALTQAVLKANETRSLRSIAQDFGPAITHGDLDRIIHGTYPKDLEKRQALGLPLF
jgi:hypothetical protein